MSSNRSYFFSIALGLLIVSVFMVFLVPSCSTNSKKLNKRVTLWKSDKIPYGSFYSYENLSHVFPDAIIEVNKLSPDRSAIAVSDYESGSDTEKERSTYIIISPTVWADDKELHALFRYVEEGNNVFISALSISDNLLDTLHLKTTYESGFDRDSDSLTVSIIKPITYDSLSYTYPGMQMDNTFSKMDSSITTILGYDDNGKANFVKFSYQGGGSLFIHLAPAAFTNFFLLHKDNKSYYDNALSYLPQNTKVVRWDEYFRNHRPGGNNFSAFGWLLKQSGLAWALWLLLLLFLIIYLFESKRKQRIIPLVVPLKNASLDFVKTIGRLYFQRGDNKNLVNKMTVHFLDHVRNRYNIPTSTLDNNFVNRLADKSGLEPQQIKDLVDHLELVQNRPLISDKILLEFNQRLEIFYKQS